MMPFTLIVAVSCGVLIALPDSLQATMSLDRDAVRMGEFWRLWSGHFVHFGLRHAALDLATLVLVSGIVERTWGFRTTAAVYGLAPALISLGTLGMAAELQVYRGSSGLAALFGVAAAIVLWHRSRRVRPAIVGLALVAVSKCLVDAVATGVDSAGGMIAWHAHVLGGVLGAVVAVGFALACRRVAAGARRRFDCPDARSRIGSIQETRMSQVVDAGR